MIQLSDADKTRLARTCRMLHHICDLPHYFANQNGVVCEYQRACSITYGNKNLDNSIRFDVLASPHDYTDAFLFWFWSGNFTAYNVICHRRQHIISRLGDILGELWFKTYSRWFSTLEIKRYLRKIGNWHKQTSRFAYHFFYRWYNATLMRSIC